MFCSSSAFSSPTEAILAQQNRATTANVWAFELTAWRSSWVDRKPAFWNYGYVKTTLDLPDDLMREVKIRAIHERKKLKDAIAELIRKGMAAGQRRPAKIPKPVKLRKGFVPTTKDIEDAIAWGRD